MSCACPLGFPNRVEHDPRLPLLIIALPRSIPVPEVTTRQVTRRSQAPFAHGPILWTSRAWARVAPRTLDKRTHSTESKHCKAQVENGIDRNKEPKKADRLSHTEGDLHPEEKSLTSGMQSQCASVAPKICCSGLSGRMKVET